MTSRSHFMLVARVANGKEANLPQLLAAVNFRPGAVNPEKEVVPFARFEGVHFAEFILLDDRPTDDMAVYNLPLRA
jgi:hypothetical protein